MSEKKKSEKAEKVPEDEGAIPTPVPEKPEKSEKKKAGKDLYKSRVRFKDWESGWTFDPAHEKPKELPAKVTDGLKSAIEKKILQKV